MTDIELVSDPERVTAEWLTTVLRAAGAIADDDRVTGFDTEAVGTGQVGDCVRFTLGYEGAAGPPTLVGKFPAADETSRGAAAVTRTYEVETRFYQQLRDRVAVTAPRPYLALLDLEANRFVILMDDLAPAMQGDQLAGCDVDAAALAMQEAAKLHAPVWGDATLEDMAWLNRASDEGRGFYRQLVTTMYPAFLDRYGDRVDPEVADVGHRLVGRLDAYLVAPSGPQTATHGDFRLDNMLFSPDGETLTTVDWQTVSLGAGVADVSYFLGTSLVPELRAGHEGALVQQYHEALLAGGVRDLTFEQCWTGYRRHAVAGLLMAVIASMLVGQTDRGDEMFMAMANRSGRMAIDLDTLTLLDQGT